MAHQQPPPRLSANMPAVRNDIQPHVQQQYQICLNSWNVPRQWSLYPVPILLARRNRDNEAIRRIVYLNGCGCNGCAVCARDPVAYLAQILDWYVNLDAANDTLTSRSDEIDLEHPTTLLWSMQDAIFHHYLVMGVLGGFTQYSTQLCLRNTIAYFFDALRKTQHTQPVCYAALFRIASFAFRNLPLPGGVDARVLSPLVLWIRQELERENLDQIWHADFMADRYNMLIRYARTMLGDMLYTTVPGVASRFGYSDVIEEVLQMAITMMNNVFWEFPVYAEMLNLNYNMQLYNPLARNLADYVVSLVKLLRIYQDVSVNLPIRVSVAGWPCEMVDILVTPALVNLQQMLLPLQREPYTTLRGTVNQMRAGMDAIFPAQGPTPRTPLQRDLVLQANHFMVHQDDSSVRDVIPQVLANIPVQLQADRAIWYFTTGTLLP